MKIAIEGCAHGQLENIYDTIKLLEEKEDIKIDLLICCGDFQSTRNEGDLRCMAIPPKYYDICTFYKYYNGEKEAPILTIFIGGNHEASNYLQELPYGGWVAPNIYYMGYAGVINVAGIRIAGLSGIYKNNDYLRGRYEKAPYSEQSKRSVYHIRNLETFRLKQLSGPLDIFLSHDWPQGICDYGNKEKLLKRKPYFKDDIDSGSLGSVPCGELLNYLKPSYWFAAHLHCKFAALVPHENEKNTKFLALDKCLPKRNFLQVVDVPHDASKIIEISYDLEWLTILFLTNHLLNVKNVINYMPGPNGNERWEFTPNHDEKSFVLERLESNLLVPKNFEKTVSGYIASGQFKKNNVMQPEAKLNPQTIQFCDKLGVDDPVSLVAEMNGTIMSAKEPAEKNDDTNISINSDEALPIKMTSLILPEPKLNISEEDPVHDAIKDKDDDKDSQKPDVATIPVLDAELLPAVDSKNESPVPKKFKRRNADLYQNEEKIA